MKVGLPQAELLSIFNENTLLRDGDMMRTKSPAHTGIWTHDLLINCCATTAAKRENLVRIIEESSLQKSHERFK